LRWQPVLGYSAKWASQIPGDEHAPPASTADYAAFAGAFAARYGEGGVFLEGAPAASGDARLQLRDLERVRDAVAGTLGAPGSLKSCFG
jgi:hypothetical protein